MEENVVFQHLHCGDYRLGNSVVRLPCHLSAIVTPLTSTVRSQFLDYKDSSISHIVPVATESWKVSLPLCGNP